MTANSRFAPFLKSAWLWLRWPAAVLILWWLLRGQGAEFDQLQHRRINFGMLGLSFVLLTASISSTFLRWWLLVQAQGFDFRLRDALRMGFVGNLLNYVAAGTVGADVAKAAMLAREQSSRRLVAASTVAIDRVIGLVALLAMGSLAAFVPTELARTGEMRAILSSYHVLGLGGMAVLALLMLPGVTRNSLVRAVPRLPVVGRFGAEMINAVIMYQSRPRVIAVTFFMSVASHAVMMMSFYCCALGVLGPGEAIPGFVEHAQLLPAAALAGVLIPLPGGVGAMEGAVAHLYPLAGVDAATGILAAVGYRVLSILLAVAGAACSMCSRSPVGKTDSRAAAPFIPAEPALETLAD